MLNSEFDNKWMEKCLNLADKAASRGDIPVGAIIVSNNKLIAAAFNEREAKKNSLGHAEIDVIRKASKKMKKWRLSDCTLYVTLEPCVMCAGAIVQSRLGRVVYGTKDTKAGAVESIYSILKDKRLNHMPVVVGGVLAEQCSKKLREFFVDLRKSKKRLPLKRV